MLGLLQFSAKLFKTNNRKTKNKNKKKDGIMEKEHIGKERLQVQFICVQVFVNLCETWRDQSSVSGNR